ncbi:MAG TPA: thioredoxin reductase, partial [Candidatus Wirthbacteria bacterium]|nr:thioredoxin reductase [Candidatus Wirthbacteria bacterium]
ALTLLPDGLWQVEVGRDVYQSKTVILANGLVWRKLGVPGEEKLVGKGVSYCATCDGAFYRDKLVGVVGGSDAACESALYLADLAEQVYIIYRKAVLRAEPIVVRAVLKNPKIQVVYDTIISKINGSDQLESVALEKIDGSTKDLGLDGLFIEIGAQPGIDFAQDLEIETDEQGYIAVDSQQRASLPGLYAAGDLTTNSGKFQQVVTAASEGAVAMMTLYRDLMTKA